jgi:NADH-quinone oxidoreductase subunit I
MDTEFELSTDDRFGGLLWDKGRLSKSNEHYREVHPTDAAVSDAILAEEKAKAEAKAKAATESKTNPAISTAQQPGALSTQ